MLISSHLLYYYVTFFLSCCLTGIFIWRWHKHFDLYFTTIYTLIPIINLGYLLLASSNSLEGALMANKIAYLGGCYLQPTFTLCILSLCNIKLRRRYQLALFLVESFIYVCVLTSERNTLFYHETFLKKVNGVSILIKTYGPVHTLFYALLTFLIVIGFIVLIYSYQKRLASRRIILLFLLNNVITLSALFVARAVGTTLELLPLSYVLNLGVFLIIIDRVCLYDSGNTILDSLIQGGNIGSFSFDLRRNYLGCDKIASQIFPELLSLHTDEKLGHLPELFDQINNWIDQVMLHKSKQEFFYSKAESTYKVTASYLYDHQAIRGYRFRVQDITKEQQYSDLLSDYNAVLEQMESERSTHVLTMQDKLTAGMADMIESRDPSTGEHIKRTSHAIRILIDEMKKDSSLHLDPAFCECVIKAAPMHDLGKIAMADAILRKPAKLTSDEYEIIKTHAVKGANIVRKILDGIDAPYFAQVAENVARYHHERFDGTGYPEGLAGTTIPLEARIMAIIDEYDALVSERCYKESLPFDQAFHIIEEGMGTQFDPSLNKYFVKCRSRLEAYYKAVL